MNKEQQELVYEAYKNYTQTKVIKSENGETHISPPGHYNGITQEEFINKCKTDSDFSEIWGVKIEERELSLMERFQILMTENFYTGAYNFKESWVKDLCDKRGIPTKQITITYNNETIESYEKRYTHF
jgi:hypothetical protein